MSMTREERRLAINVGLTLRKHIYAYAEAQHDEPVLYTCRELYRWLIWAMTVNSSSVGDFSSVCYFDAWETFISLSDSEIVQDWINLYSPEI